MIPALGAGGRGFDSPLAPFADQAFLAQMVERWPFKPMVVGSIPTEGVTLLVGVVGNISACHADARGSIPRRGAFWHCSTNPFDKKRGESGFRSRCLVVANDALYRLS